MHESQHLKIQDNFQVNRFIGSMQVPDKPQTALRNQLFYRDPNLSTSNVGISAN